MKNIINKLIYIKINSNKYIYINIKDDHKFNLLIIKNIISLNKLSQLFFNFSLNIINSLQSFFYHSSLRLSSNI